GQAGRAPGPHHPRHPAAPCGRPGVSPHMDLSVEYLGLKLAHPLIPGASPLAHEVGTARALEDAGAPAITLRSLFEEQLTQEQLSTFMATEQYREFTSEATSMLAEPANYRLGPDAHLEENPKTRART